MTHLLNLHQYSDHHDELLPGHTPGTPLLVYHLTSSHNNIIIHYITLYNPVSEYEISSHPDMQNAHVHIHHVLYTPTQTTLSVHSCSFWPLSTYAATNQFSLYILSQDFNLFVKHSISITLLFHNMDYQHNHQCYIQIHQHVTWNNP